MKFSAKFDINSSTQPTASLPYPIPAILKMAFVKDPQAKAAFNALPAGRQKEIARYLGFMKNEESLKRNVDRVIKHLRGEDTGDLQPLFQSRQD